MADEEDTDRFDRTLSMRRVPPRATASEQAPDKRATERRQGNSRILIGTIITIAVLHLARPVVVPVALAVLFAFLLTPIVMRLERTFLRRTGAIVLSLGLTTLLLGFGGWWIYQQLNSVAAELSGAATSKNMERKLEQIRKRAGQFNLLERALQRVAEAGDRPQREDLKVRVLPERKTIADRYEDVAPTVEGVAASFLVIVVVFFLLRDREQLRDKLLRVAGRAHLTVTTQAIGETSQRISRYLLTIALLNIGFGLLIGLGLWSLRV
ncbi:MAG TPA: AI-2E family transporter, partial [Thermoanaerobaculia bacterium]|nr:AI-2E family transporter [Thermoanaerobaculia bacterium]